MKRKEKEKAFQRMNNSVTKDLKSYADKWQNFKHKEEHLRKWPFFMQLRDACHNALEVGACAHVLNDMIKDAKKEALTYHRDLYKEGK